MDRMEVHDILVESFTLNDIQCICRFVGCDHEDLPADTKTTLSLQLIKWAERRNRYDQLVRIIHKIFYYSDKFNTEELKTLAFSLNITLPYDNASKVSIIVQILYLVQRDGLTGPFMSWLEMNRPDISMDT